jgi:uncharacterized protein
VATREWLLDTGVLVAWIDRGDAAHLRCLNAVRSVRLPVVTCGPVVFEAAYVLSRPSGYVARAVDGLIRDGLIRMEPLPPDALPWIAAFQHKYADLRPDFADAALCWLAERRGLHRVLTLDRDFTIYRRDSGEPFDVRPGPVD